MEIRLLDEKTIQKIAAGEVIESPISIVKELVENSIDAKSTEISVEIRHGGKDLIVVRDNGSGIEESQIENAFLRHSTSKIDNFEDLYRIHSLGFRGEALASIVAVAKVEASSRTEDKTSGIKVEYQNGELKKRSKIGMNKGTSMVVRDLFYNIPVRRNFLSSDNAEANKITKLLYSLAIGNNDIAFTYIKDGKIVFKTNGDGLRNALLSLYGKEYIDKAQEIENENYEYKIYGLISDNRFYRGNRSMEYIYVNNRNIDQEEITNIIEKQYKDFIPTSRFPAFQIFIETNPNNIDINIHPNKMKIKFKNLDSLLDLIEKTTLSAIFKSQSEYQFEEKEEKEKIQIDNDDSYQRIVDAYSGKKNEFTGLDFVDLNENTNDSNDDDSLDIDEYLSIDIGNDFKEELEQVKEPVEDFDSVFTRNIDDYIKTSDDENIRRQYKYVGNIFNTYILFEKYEDETLVFLDIQSSDERILFEEILEEYKTDEFMSQRTIDPVIMRIDSIEKEKFENKKNKFEELGFDIELFDDDNLIVRGFPYILEEIQNEQSVRDLIDLDDQADEEEYLNELTVIANRNSLKKGNLPGEEGSFVLLENLLNTSKPFQSPHGRPTMYILNKRDIDRKFLRK